VAAVGVLGWSWVVALEKGASVTNRVEAVGATASSGASLVFGITDANAWLQLAIGVATLAWWLRLWIRNPKLKPPTE
jgi:hypothetical protein